MCTIEHRANRIPWPVVHRLVDESCPCEKKEIDSCVLNIRKELGLPTVCGEIFTPVELEENIGTNYSQIAWNLCRCEQQIR